MDELKIWAVEVLVKKLGPSAIRGAFLGIVAWLCTKNNMLSQFGISSNSSTHITVIDWNVLSAWAIAGLPAALAAGIKLFQHHTISAIEGKPQSGNMRINENQTLQDGSRESDNKAS